jgi:hypothetical protein
MRILKSIFGLIPLVLLSSACTSTRVLDTWSQADYQAQRGEKIAVLSIHPRLDIRKAQQAYLVELLEENGYDAVGGLEIFSPEFEPSADNLEAMRQRLRAEGVDQVLTVSLLDTERSDQYVSGNYNTVPRTFFNPFFNYFFITYQQVYQPGYYYESVDVIMESKLFDVETGELAWTGQSSTPQSASPRSFGKDFARGIIEALSRDQVLQ